MPSPSGSPHVRASSSSSSSPFSGFAMPNGELGSPSSHNHGARGGGRRPSDISETSEPSAPGRGRGRGRGRGPGGGGRRRRSRSGSRSGSDSFSSDSDRRPPRRRLDHGGPPPPRYSPQNQHPLSAMRQPTPGARHQRHATFDSHRATLAGPRPPVGGGARPSSGGAAAAASADRPTLYVAQGLTSNHSKSTSLSMLPPPRDVGRRAAGDVTNEDYIEYRRGDGARPVSQTTTKRKPVPAYVPSPAPSIGRVNSYTSAGPPGGVAGSSPSTAGTSGSPPIFGSISRAGRIPAQGRLPSPKLTASSASSPFMVPPSPSMDGDSQAPLSDDVISDGGTRRRGVRSNADGVLFGFPETSSTNKIKRKRVAADAVAEEEPTMASSAPTSNLFLESSAMVQPATAVATSSADVGAALTDKPGTTTTTASPHPAAASPETVAQPALTAALAPAAEPAVDRSTATKRASASSSFFSKWTSFVSASKRSEPVAAAMADQPSTQTDPPTMSERQPEPVPPAVDDVKSSGAGDEGVPEAQVAATPSSPPADVEMTDHDQGSVAHPHPHHESSSTEAIVPKLAPALMMAPVLAHEAKHSTSSSEREPVAGPTHVSNDEPITNDAQTETEDEWIEANDEEADVDHHNDPTAAAAAAVSKTATEPGHEQEQERAQALAGSDLVPQTSAATITEDTHGATTKKQRRFSNLLSSSKSKDSRAKEKQPPATARSKNLFRFSKRDKRASVLSSTASVDNAASRSLPPTLDGATPHQADHPAGRPAPPVILLNDEAVHDPETSAERTCCFVLRPLINIFA